MPNLPGSSISRSNCWTLEYREAFILKYYQGYSYQEMSTVTGASVDALPQPRLARERESKEALAVC